MSCKLVDALKRTVRLPDFTMISYKTNYSYMLIVLLRGPFTTRTNSGVHILFHSLEGNKVGKSGASAFADTLRVNQSLKTLK